MGETGGSRQNTRARFSVEFEAADILMMADALSIGSITAKMCGDDAAGKRLRELCDMFCEMSPLPKSSGSRGYEWFQVCRMLSNAPWFEAFVTNSDSSWEQDKAHVDVDVGGKVVRVCERLEAEEAAACVEPLNEFLAEIAGMDAQRLVRTTARIQLPEGTSTWGNKLLASARDAVAALTDGQDVTCVLRAAKYCYGEKQPTAEVTVAVPVAQREDVLAMLQGEPETVPSPGR